MLHVVDPVASRRTLVRLGLLPFPLLPLVVVGGRGELVEVVEVVSIRVGVIGRMW